MSEMLSVYHSFVSLNQIYLEIYSFTLDEIYILHTNNQPFFVGTWFRWRTSKALCFLQKKVSEKLFNLAEMVLQYRLDYLIPSKHV